MSNQSECARRVTWPGGEHDFDLGADRARRLLAGDGRYLPVEFLQSGYPMSGAPLAGQFGDTPAACLKRFQNAVYSMGDVERILEIGLYGAGMEADEAIDLVEEHVHGKPIGAVAMIAYGILLSLFMSPEDMAAAEAKNAAGEG